jgi:ribulose-5-phosphate 4-epimerase/fuculose-1-phosphate aldolase
VKKGSDLLIRTPALGQALARTLAKKPAALMRGRGSVVVGESLPRAVGRSVYLELSARMQMQALLLSKRITYIDAAEVKASNPVQDYKRAWPMWRERALARAKVDRG